MNSSSTLTAAESIAEAFRLHGHLEANLDPMGRLKPAPQPGLQADGPEARRFRAIYCSTIGVEIEHIPDADRRRWVCEQMESDRPQPDSAWILERLISSDTYEKVLQSRYPGAKRFSLEGATAVIPLLDQLLETGADNGATECMLAMSHRGRLNVLFHTVGRGAAQIMAGFEDVDPRSVLGGGDVKYHWGGTGEYRTRSGQPIWIALVSNASHLEAVDPVAMGRARARQDRLGGDAWKQVLPITMHGDAAFAGQGMVAETLNMSALPGYSVGGTIHVVVNNLVGFTTEPVSLFSSRYATDVAKRLPVPIFHVNGEDPEAVVRAARIAAEFRYHFQSDVIIDLVGYRLHGHSEVEDPTVTQPLLYDRIKQMRPTWKTYAEDTGVAVEAAERHVQELHDEMDRGQAEARAMEEAPVLRELPDYWSRFTGGPYRAEYEVDTAVPAGRIREITGRISSIPDGFHPHVKIRRLLEQRREMGHGKRPVDWGMAEALAFGSLVQDGTPVRFSGQDSRRGTFNHRHAVLVDIEDASEYYPLRQVSPNQARFEIYDSPLSEGGPVGFEFGYSRSYPDALVLWEAQFGDFANGAQVLIDQFVAATEDKWLLLSGLVLLLPHGYEGQGPEHSSARLERFLQLAGEQNIQVCQPSTAAQYFHLLRRQAIRRWHKPLIVFTPKSMLRHPAAMSPAEELSRGRFLTVVPDEKAGRARRIVVCTGKIGHELRAERDRRGEKSVAVVVLDQLYPFPDKELANELKRHGNPTDIVWVQEEPANMGALFFVRPRIQHLAGQCRVRSVKRSASASPATGSMKAHTLEQNALLALAFAKQN